MILLEHPFQIELVNGIQGDPSVFLFSAKSGDAVLFDLGSLEPMSHKNLLRVTHAFVSHTHIDHFIGFDRLLRVNVPHGRPLEFCGPPGFIANVAGKLHGYHWNLLDPGQLRYIAHEVDLDGVVKSARLDSDDKFVPKAFKSALAQAAAPVANVSQLGDKSVVSAVALDHGTPSIAYCMREPAGFTVDVAALEKLGLQPGPWLRDLQIAMANGGGDKSIEVDGKAWKARTLAGEVMQPKPGKSFGYLTDICFSQGNLDRLRKLMADCDALICESNFDDVDYKKAVAKKHLTNRQAALIAVAVGARHLKVFHISNIYSEAPEAVAKQAEMYFEELSKLSAHDLEMAIQHELDRCHKPLIS